jgi:hypothetical protein
MARKRYSEPREAKRFAVIVFFLLLALASFSTWRGHYGRAAAVAIVGFVCLILPLASFPAWLWVFRKWMKLAEGLSWVSTRVLLATFFYLVLTPFGIVMRAFGKDLLDRKFRDGRATYWKDREPITPTVERYAKRF